MSEEKGRAGTSFATKSSLKPPENFFPIVVDNFFSDPEMLVDYGKSLPKDPDEEGAWPGKRSKRLFEIDQALQNIILLKIMSCYHDFGCLNIIREAVCDMGFQEISRFSENKNDIRNRGWIHRDESEHQLAGLIYLTPNIDPDSGTSLYNLKTNKYKDYTKYTSHKTYDQVDEEDYTKSLIKHEEYFFEKTRFQNIFNRLIMYDTHEWHRANSYYNYDGEDARLTLGFFVAGLNVHPLKRIKKSIIKLRLEKNENK